MLSQNNDLRFKPGPIQVQFHRCIYQAYGFEPLTIEDTLTQAQSEDQIPAVAQIQVLALTTLIDSGVNHQNDVQPIPHKSL